MAFVFEESKGVNSDRENIVIPDRRYPAVFKSYNTYQRTNKKTGEPEDRIAWTFEVQGKTDTKEIPGFTSTKWGWEEKPSNSRKWMAALQGKRASDLDLNRDLDAMVGKPCEVSTITLGEGDDAKSIVENVYPVLDEDDPAF